MIPSMPRGTPRIVSLLPAATEIVAALGLASSLVGRSHECDHPPEVAPVPVLTRARVGAFPASAAIDADLQSLLSRALSIYTVDLEALRAARPDVVITQDLCAVCAVTTSDVQAALGSIGLPDCEVVSLAPRRLSEILADIRRVGARLHAQKAAATLLEVFEARMQRVRGRTLQLERKRLLTLEWLAPPMVGGLWMADLADLAGADAIATSAGEPGRSLRAEELASLVPEVIVVKPCGFEISRTLAEAASLRALLAAIGGDALTRDAVYIADGNAFFNRPGPRIVDSLEILGCCVHPEAFPDLAERRKQGFVRFR